MTSEQLASLEHDFGLIASLGNQDVQMDTMDLGGCREQDTKSQPAEAATSAFDGQEIPF